jgi:hypothetical protein
VPITQSFGPGLFIGNCSLEADGRTAIPSEPACYGSRRSCGQDRPGIKLTPSGCLSGNRSQPTSVTRDFNFPQSSTPASIVTFAMPPPPNDRRSPGLSVGAIDGMSTVYFESVIGAFTRGFLLPLFE